MTTIERLDRWRATGIITDAQQRTLGALARHERFSVFVELSAFLYLGVLSIVSGLAWTFRDYVQNLGDAAILTILLLLTGASFAYCISRVAPYRYDEVESPSLAFDYVVYFGCLMFSATLAFLEAQFGIFQGWDTHLLIAALVFAVVAYRFDNRFVLSLALSSLAYYVGLKAIGLDNLEIDRLRGTSMLYGGFLIGIGLLLYRQGIKRHFLDVHIHLGANAIMFALLSGVGEPGTGLAYLAALLIAAALSIYLGVRHGRFAFVAYGTLYGYAALSIRLLEWVTGVIGPLLYFIVTGTIVVIGLVVLARKFGRDE